EVFYSRFDSISWTPPVNASRIVGGSVDPRIATDSNNNPRVVWEERKGGYSVYYTYFDGTDWVNAIKVDSFNAITPDITIDKENKSYIAWVKTDLEEIFNAIYIDSTQISPPENASNTDSFSARPSIVTNSEYVHLVWLDFLEATSGHSEIFHSREELSGIDEKENNNINFSLPSIIIKKLSFCFSLPEPSSVYVFLYDVAGKKVKETPLGFKDKGNHNYSLSLNLPSGIYFAVLTTDTKIYRGKFILLNHKKGGM
ncbi:MAG: T9SS type A sorting domain-containing protein, partial [Bacteroidetes bacterium]|nr:T9SS type A sorting domain-containing protein [Bacteroidota bacterium]